MILALCTAYLFNILWAWAVLDVVPQYNTCSVNTQSNTTQCEEAEYTLLRLVLVFCSNKIFACCVSWSKDSSLIDKANLHNYYLCCFKIRYYTPVLYLHKIHSALSISG